MLTIDRPSTAEDNHTPKTSLFEVPDNRIQVDFTLDLAIRDGRCVGRTSEPNTFGDRSATHLFANITCRSLDVGPGQTFAFHKQYDGTGGVSHGVEYSGIVSPDGHTVTGQWRIGRTSGQFSMTRVVSQ
jgi:hypothetical protein